MTALLEARGLTVRFPGRRGASVLALDAVDLEIPPGTTLGVVGESGSGKTTLGRVLLGLQRRIAGSVRYGDVRIGPGGEVPPGFRRRAQIVFQDPFGSLNPRLTVEQTLREVLTVTGKPRRDGSRTVRDLLGRVGLPGEVAPVLPHALSGGQLQRVAIARALAVQPEFLVLDEPVSALDVSVQARILNLLLDLQESMGLTYLFISHDLAVVRRVSDRILVMQEGRVVERGDPDSLARSPSHPYTRTLLAAALPWPPGELGDGGPEGEERRRRGG
ncbi:MAG: ATP-binding cassette domain-containing protein [Gemmatimonadota bacterium]